MKEQKQVFGQWGQMQDWGWGQQVKGQNQQGTTALAGKPLEEGGAELELQTFACPLPFQLCSQASGSGVGDQAVGVLQWGESVRGERPSSNRNGGWQVHTLKQDGTFLPLQPLVVPLN